SPPAPIRSNAVQCCPRDAQPADTRNRCPTPLVANVSSRPGFVARKQPASRSAWVWALTVLADFRFARARWRLSAEVRQKRAIASSSSNENVDFHRDDKRLAHPFSMFGANVCTMPEEETLERAREDEREGKSPSTQAGEFVREEMEHIREGNTARARPSKRSPSVCQKPVAPASTCHRQSEGRAN